MNELIAFFSAAIISLWGSLQLGIVNIQVIKESLIGNKKGAILIALGGVLPEIPYTLVAIYFVEVVEKYPQITGVVSVAVVLLLLSLAYYYFFKAKPIILKDIDNTDIAQSQSKRPFIKGFTLAMMNPQLIFFWAGIIFLIENGALDLNRVFPDFSMENGTFFTPRIAFIIGTSFGAFCILWVYSYLAFTFKEKLRRLLKFNFNYLTGTIFIFIAVMELIRNVNMWR